MTGPGRGRRRDIVVIGASAGGVDALSGLVQRPPRDLGAAVFVVLHVSPSRTSVLPMILSRRGALPAEHPLDGSVIERGRIYVAPPDRHLVLEDSRIRVIPGPKQNGHRPAIDPLFRSAARTFRERVIGVILSGTLDDGTLGLRAVKKLGGVALVQDPEEALYPAMPNSAIVHAGPDRVGSIGELAQVIVDLASTVSENGRRAGESLEGEGVRRHGRGGSLERPAGPGGTHVPEEAACPPARPGGCAEASRHAKRADRVGPRACGRRAQGARPGRDQPSTRAAGRGARLVRARMTGV